MGSQMSQVILSEWQYSLQSILLSSLYRWNMGPKRCRSGSRCQWRV